STFLSVVSNARPKIANYHFTTLNPNLGVVDLEGADGFVIADIPGLIEGASEGVGLGHEFLRHIERTKVIIHMVDAASTEGRDPINDIKAINEELSSYDPALLEKPQVIAANKCDVFYGSEEDTVISLLREEFEPQGIQVYPISAVTGRGVRELLYHVRSLLDTLPQEPVMYEPEFDPAELAAAGDEPIEIEKVEEHVFRVEGPRVERMLGYTNIDDEKGFEFFQKFMRENEVYDRLEELGIEEGDTVRLYGLEFDYYR
ncbi:MAG: Obg family GTPase CgtA, partial [Lachnospiraceae bacterium]|nr:Obg family GTPase CgtA [Lachnospiraceae bacterium]